MEKVRVGIIGTGFTIGIANAHVQGYQRVPGCELVAMYDKIPGRAAKFMEKFKIEGLKACESLEEFYSMVDAVSVCTPNNEHANLAIDAMNHGKHVIVEKPFSTSYEEGLRALNASKEHSELVCMTVFNYREQVEVQQMKRIIDSGILGKIISVRHIGGGGRMWDGEHVFLEWRMQEKTSGTGAMADFGVHMLDLTDYLLHDIIGDYVQFNGMTSTLVKERYVINEKDVMGDKKGDEKAPVTNDDIATFSALSESGCLCTFETGRLVGSMSMFEIAGDQGIVLRNNTLYPAGKMGLFDRSKTKGPFPSFETIDIDADIMESRKNSGLLGHDGVLGEFIDCIQTGKKPVRDFRHGLYIQKLIDNFSSAAKTGQTVYEKVSESEIQ
ncbi:MAG: Gfo/Idh/MocA family oxidoreductase [Lachnospiraceae bacterium]|nr:Gfo/Idh/MocA family oxidoreductase [Lachnospiraceae bacterium]